MSLSICVYAICKNEAKHVKRCLDAVFSELQEQDRVVVYDTGSTDNSVELFQQYDDRLFLRYNFPLEQFRFDVARNIALNDIPENIDVCIKLDLDEVLSSGWRDAIEKDWNKKYNGPQRLYVDFVWNHKDDGSPNKRFLHDCIIHSRKHWHWVNACHEVIQVHHTYKDSTPMTNMSNVQIHHWADNTKPRSSYLNLLAIDRQEKPYDPRVVLYYARELWFNNRLQEAQNEFEYFLTMKDTWNVERAYVYRILARIAVSMNNKQRQKAMLFRAVSEAPEEREPWLDLALSYNDKELGKAWAALEALKITDKKTHYLVEESSWSELPYDLVSVGACWNGMFDIALQNAQKAVEINSLDKRLQQNLSLIKQIIKDKNTTH